MPRNTANFGAPTAEICWRVCGTSENFNGFHVLTALLNGTLVVGVSQTLWCWKRAQPIFGRAAITLGIDAHSSFLSISVLLFFFSFLHYSFCFVFFGSVWQIKARYTSREHGCSNWRPCSRMTPAFTGRVGYTGDQHGQWTRVPFWTRPVDTGSVYRVRDAY